MNQDVIWDHFQSEGAEAFRHSDPRLAFLASRLRPSERVLNIGVGTGGLERQAAAKGVEIWSLDPSERAIERLRRELDLGERAKAGYSQDMPFPHGQFDAVVMSEVVEHLADDILMPTLAEVERVLKPGGRFIGTVPARENLADNEAVCPCCEHRFHRWGHVRSFDVADLRRLLETRFEVAGIGERFFADWEGAKWRRRIAGLAKRFLSWRGIGTYGANRSIFFVARRKG